MGNTITIAVIVAAFVALFALRPDEQRLQAAFMNHGHHHFFELPEEYRDIYQELRNDSLTRKRSHRIRYGNFLLFSTLSYDSKKWSRKILAAGALGFSFAVTL